MAVTHTDEPGLTRAQKFASLHSTGKIHDFYVSEWLNDQIAKLCRSTEDRPVAHLTIIANRETGDLLWLETDPSQCTEEVVASYSLELLESSSKRKDYLDSPLNRAYNRAYVTCRLTVNEVEQADFRVTVWIKGSEGWRVFVTSSYSHSQVHYEVLRCHFNYLRRDPATHWAAEELEDL